MNLHTAPSSSRLNDFFVVAGLAEDFKLLQTMNPLSAAFSASSPSSTNSKTVKSTTRSTNSDLGIWEESFSSTGVDERVSHNRSLVGNGNIEKNYDMCSTDACSSNSTDDISPITSIIFSAAITDYYGSTDAGAMPEGIELFAFPQGLRLVQRSAMPKYHSFVHTSESGLHLYGSCVTFFEKITEEQVQRAYTLCKESSSPLLASFNATDFRGLYVPRVICIISRWPFIDAFREVLCEFYRLSCTPCDLPLERYICNFIDDIPAPPASGNTNIYFYINDKGINFECPPANQPTAWKGIPIAPVMESLDAANIIELFTAVLCERQILFVSSQYSLLTYAAETITSLLYPFVWSHVYIPLLPFQLVGVLEAPMPFIVGMHSSWLNLADLNVSEEAVIVYLDENKIVHGVLGPPPRINDHRYQKLLSAIKEHAPVFTHRDTLYSNDWHNMRLATFDNAFQLPSLPLDTNHDSGMDNLEVNEKKIRESFLNFFVTVLIDYRSYLIKGQKYKKFKDTEFVRSQPADSRNFFTIFTKSQAFHQFVDERLLVDASDPDVAFFEESIAAKINRCKSRKTIAMIFSGKIETPFLDEIPSYVTHVPPKPDNSGLDGLRKNQDDKFVYNSFPKMNPALYSLTKLSYVSPAEIRTLTSRHTRLKRWSVELNSRRKSSILGRPLSGLRHTPPSGVRTSGSGKQLDGRKTFKDTDTSNSSSPTSSSSPMKGNSSNIGATHDGTGFEYSSTTTAGECIKSIYLVVLAQFSRYQSIKSGKSRGKFKSTAAIIDEYSDLRVAPDGDLSIALSPEMIAQEDARYMYSPSRTPTTIHGNAILKIGKESNDRVASLPSSSGSGSNSTPEKDLAERGFQFINWCFHNSNASVHCAILTLQCMACVHQYPDDIAYRLIADVCAAGFLPERAVDLMVVMEKQGVLIDSKIANAISVAFSGSDNQEISTMTAADVMSIDNWALFRVNLFGRVDDSIDGITQDEDYIETEWIGFSEYTTSDVTKAVEDDPLWRFRKVINPSKDTLPMLQWSDELLCQLVPGVKIDLNNPAGTSCPSATCGRDLNITDLYEEWDTDPNQYKVRCRYCNTEFVPRFTVLCDFMSDIKNGDENDRILWCELLSPWVLAKEIKTILIEDGVKTFLKPSFRVSHHVIFWNMILAFRLYGLPYVFLLLEGFRQQGITVSIKNE